MTEVDITRIGKWWNSISRFLWAGFGMLCIIVGIFQYICDGNKVWAVTLIGSGITITILPLTIVKCPNCDSPNPFQKIWKPVYEHKQFACQACGAQHKLPTWSRLLLNAITFGYGFLTVAAGYNEFIFNFTSGAPGYLTVVNGFPLAWALTMLLVRFSRYEPMDGA